MTDAEFRPPRQPLLPPGGVEIFHRDMTVTVAADVILSDVQRHLAAAGQWLPVDGDPAQPVGRLVETNSTGPLRLGYGAWRDLLLGGQFHNHRGELITPGGRTVKNVAGYDLTKFIVGQQGHLGRIVTVTTRTYLRPAGAVVVRLPHEPVGVSALLASALRPQWMMLVPDALLLGYLGDDALLDYCFTKASANWPGAATRRSIEEDIAERASTFSKTYDQGVTFRASLPPARVFEFVAKLPSGVWAADPAFGIVRGNVAEQDLDASKAAAQALEGRLWRETGQTINPGPRGELLHRLRSAFGPTTQGQS
jgi:hypothetical protein